jgi:hypothetical protein
VVSMSIAFQFKGSRPVRGPDLGAMLVPLPENQRKVIVMLKVLGVTLQGLREVL